MRTHNPCGLASLVFNLRCCEIGLERHGFDKFGIDNFPDIDNLTSSFDKPIN